MSGKDASDKSLNLSSIPPIFILPIHLSTDDLHDFEDQIFAADGALTYKPTEARVFIGKISQKKRAAFELRSKGVWTEEVKPLQASAIDRTSPHKRRKLNNENLSGVQIAEISSDTEEETKDLATPKTFTWPDLSSHVLVLKTEWLIQCLKHNAVVPYSPHLVYTGKIISKPIGETSPQPITYIKATPESTSPVSRSNQSLANVATTPTPKTSLAALPARRFNSSKPDVRSSLTTIRNPPKLQRDDTTHNSRDPSPSSLPPLPTWTEGSYASYACCRSTPLHPTNKAFIDQLSEIKLHRLLTLDEIGVRAYSTSIASLSAYPHSISHEAEILRLPGCNRKIADLWREWYESATTDEDRSIDHVRQLHNDKDLTVLKLFWNIWGVGPETARKFYFDKGWRDLDDVVEYGWHTLNRVQQIGVKYYDEFLIGVPRAETERIAQTVLRHARLCRGIPEENWEGGENDMVCVVVGGYRRGKEESGDVDIILSHREENMTKDLVVDVVRSLEEEGWITHTLTLQTSMTERAQQTLPYRSEGGGHGFDSLDKALCVWQDPTFEAVDEDGMEVEKNPNIHRRVDIILSPWRTVGCAVLGWSGGTTFQRDIRRFASKVKGWKYDSSGVRNRGTGHIVDLEGHEKGGWEAREKALMEGLGIGWRPASERCTG